MALVYEFTTPFDSSADFVRVDMYGNIMIVECKLANDPDARAKVVGQILGYAAWLQGMSYERFDSRFRRGIGRTLVEHFATSAPQGWDAETFRQQVTENLAAGRFRLVIALDAFPKQLAQTLSFLLRYTTNDFDLHVLELPYYSNDEIEVIVPETYAQQDSEVKAHTADPALDLLEVLQSSCSPVGYDAARRLIEWLKERYQGVVERGTGKDFTAKVKIPFGNTKLSVLHFYRWPEMTGPWHVAITFEYLRPRAAEEKLKRLADRLRAIPAFAEHRDVEFLEQFHFKKRPGVKIEEFLVPETYYQVVIGALDELLADLTGQSAAEAARSYGDQSDQT
ncbi:hypothetical protein NET02_02530 [Thermomicrobiaceae bacterium CFH 74404]|uniref:DUF4268 domain-containing protein n=1 Tax=Thermalbibacter longus TaxID=2951981 RepID=A0AA41W9T8_9BACT|nr:hypothetical protein [Thermalbibacter longus]MCM8748017.1 hypothetical protein [Thermalbibacter longus]